MAMVIVTQNQYILASKIHHVTLDEHVENFEYRNGKGRMCGAVLKKYVISVYYTPEDATPNNQLSSRNNGDIRECSVELRGALNAHLVFKDLIRQIREQMPDQLYLDTALERMIAGIDVNALKDKDLADEFKQEATNDRSSAKVRRARKAKRRSKKVLRRAKRSR